MQKKLKCPCTNFSAASGTNASVCHNTALLKVTSGEVDKQ